MMKAVKMQNAVHHREKKIHNNNANRNNSNHIDKLRCFDVAEMMQSFLWGFFFYCWRHSKEAHNASVWL